MNKKEKRRKILFVRLIAHFEEKENKENGNGTNMESSSPKHLRVYETHHVVPPLLLLAVTKSFLEKITSPFSLLSSSLSHATHAFNFQFIKSSTQTKAITHLQKWLKPLKKF